MTPDDWQLPVGIARARIEHLERTHGANAVLSPDELEWVLSALQEGAAAIPEIAV